MQGNVWRTNRFLLLSSIADSGLSGGPVVSEVDGKVIGMLCSSHHTPGSSAGHIFYSRAVTSKFIEDAVAVACQKGHFL